MLNLKKLIASIAAITVALSSVAFAATYTDVAEDSAYYEAVESLSKLGIVTGYEDGTYKPEETVTRAEMAALIARIQGFGDTAKGSTNTVFTDVPASHWASGYVAQASNQGIVNGYGDGTFGPEDPVLYEQAVKMIMATLGYTYYAENNGSYPTGYLTAASRQGVTDGVSNAVPGTGANRGTIAQLLANAIDTPIMQPSKWATDGTIEYTIYDGSSASQPYKTLMSENLGVVKLKGIVESNSVTKINGSKTINTDKAAEVNVNLTGSFDTTNKDFKSTSTTTFTLSGGNNRDFLVGETDAEAYLGKAVIFYVVYNDYEDKYEIVSIAADSTKNDTISFTIDKYEDYTAPELKYFEELTDKDPAKVTLDDGVDVVYNGVGGNTMAAMDAMIVNGHTFKYGGMITLINNDNDSDYDVVIVEAAATAVVKGVSEDGIAFKKGVNLPDGASNLSEILIDADDESKVVVITKDGEEVDFATLTEWDVLSVIAASETAKYITVEVIGTSIVGTVSSKSTSQTSDANTAWTVEGTKYDVATGAYGKEDLSVGAGGTFYIDKYGKIAAFNEDLALATGVAGNYGFVTKAIVENDTIDGKTVTIQMITANGVEAFDLATNVTFNISKQVKPADVAVTSPATATSPETDFVAYLSGAPISAADGNLKGEVIRYTTNSNGKINSILQSDIDTDKFDDLAITPDTSATSKFDADNSKLGNYYIDADTTVFFVTSTPYDTDKCLVGTAADLEDQNMYKLLAVYADTKATDNNIVVVEDGLTTASPTTGVAIITGVATSELDGDDIYVLEYMLGGETYEAETVVKSDLGAPYAGTAPTIGDVVKVKVNSEGKISGLQAVWNFAETVRNTSTGAVGLGALTTDSAIAALGEDFGGGFVTAYKESSEQATVSTGETYKLSQAENVYVIEQTSRGVEVRKGSSTSFKYLENIYSPVTGAEDTYVSVKVDGAQVAIADKTNRGASSAWENAVKAYTDYVYVRTYDSKVKDVVIVKAMRNVSASLVPAVTISFNLGSFDQGSVTTPPADVVTYKGGPATLPAFTGINDGTNTANTWVGAAATYTADVTLTAAYVAPPTP